MSVNFENSYKKLNDSLNPEDVLIRFPKKLIMSKRLFRPLSLSNITDRRLIQLAESCCKYTCENNIRSSIRILWPTTFNLSKTWWTHDGILAAAFRLRGAEIIPTMCGRLQSDECIFWAGEWQRSGKQGFRKRRNIYCSQCIRNDIEMWGQWGLSPLNLALFIKRKEILEGQEKVKKWMTGDWQKVRWRGFKVGYEAWKAVVNNALQAEINNRWSKQAASLAYHHLLNIYLLLLVYERVFEVAMPDRVFGNGGFYYQWGVVNYIARQRGIPYFRYHKIGLHPLAWNYARNNLQLIDVSHAWKSWLKRPWYFKQEQRVNNDLIKRGLPINCKSSRKKILRNVSQQFNLDSNKPIVLAATGVAWDATTNVPSKLFKNMYSWIRKTISWFAKNPQWQLVIRIHPKENVIPNIASGKRTGLERELDLKGVKLPQNVFIVPSFSRISTYDLMAIATLGIFYTSTTGLEAACVGLPVVAVGPAHYCNKGFTFDPSSSKEYFVTLKNILLDKVKYMIKEKSLLAKRYWYLYAYHGSIMTGLMELDKNGVEIPKKLTYRDLLPHANPYLDYIWDSVINDLPIMGKNRWPPERKE